MPVPWAALQASAQHTLALALWAVRAVQHLRENTCSWLVPRAQALSETLYPVWELFQMKSVTLSRIKTNVFYRRKRKRRGPTRVHASGRWCVHCALIWPAAPTSVYCGLEDSPKRLRETQEIWVKMLPGHRGGRLPCSCVSFFLLSIRLTLAVSPVPSAPGTHMSVLWFPGIYRL